MSEQNNEQRSQAAGTDTVDRGNSNAKLEQLEAYREDATGEALSTNTGTRIADNQNTLRPASADRRCSKTSSCARRSPTSTTSAFPSAWSTLVARRRMATSRPTRTSAT